jgi:hypothetical protein
VLSRAVHPWTPPYDKTFAVVVRAEDEEAARSLALTVGGNEGRGIYRQFGYAEDQRPTTSGSIGPTRSAHRLNTRESQA